jgi:predicted YcjX-like family ATPase
MTGKKSGDPTPESIARANRQRLAHEEGLRAMADVEREAVAVRKNMERLRALREAREAEAQLTTVVPGTAPAKKRKKPLSK